MFSGWWRHSHRVCAEADTWDGVGRELIQKDDKCQKVLSQKYRDAIAQFDWQLWFLNRFKTKCPIATDNRDVVCRILITWRFAYVGYDWYVDFAMEIHSEDFPNVFYNDEICDIRVMSKIVQWDTNLDAYRI